ncbi:MAG TPA: periplasmic heavy metal sensor [Thermoanaerobaculaceae bacterium]|nr:periplasmic heavy metal sensor [Thermoanaerobaculaceae bacterium]HPS79753.1 periplasmic heavy metal sensor [Thermoanaerobaculaceae bacterium]
MEDNVTATRPTRRWRRPVLVVAGLALVLGGIGGLAWATGVGPATLGPGFGHGFGTGAHVREFVEFRLHRELKAVDATEAQEAQILATLDTLFAAHQAHEAFHKEMHDQVAAALSGATVDRAALEAARVQILRRADLGSKELVKAIADMAEVLTPAQRQALAEKHRQHFE